MQAPFITLFMYINEVPEGQAREDHVRVIEEVIKQRIQGVKNEKGVWITPAFPKLIYVLDENNTYQGSKYFWLTRYACECISRRMVPDFISAKIQRQLKDGNVYPCMGCVDGSSVIDYKFKGEKYVESFKDAWERLSKEYDVLYQPNGKDLYMDTDGVEIFDCERLEYVKQYRIIRNTQESWYHLDIRTFVGDTKYTRSLDVTNNHPLDIKGKGVIFAEELEVGDIIDASNGIFEIREISSYYDKKYSYDVTTESEHFMVNGIYSHNCRSFLTSEKDIRNPDGTQKFYGRLTA